MKKINYLMLAALSAVLAIGIAAQDTKAIFDGAWPISRPADTKTRSLSFKRIQNSS